MNNNKAAKFWDKIAKRYAKNQIADDASYQAKLKTTQQYLKPDMKLLEIGCGTGSTALKHAPHVNHIHAIDISNNMLEIARDKARIQDIENIDFECASLTDIAPKDNSLDAILTLNVLHLVDDKEAMIAQIHQALKPDGVFVSSTMCLDDNMKFLKYILPVGRALGLLPLVKFFTAEELEASLTNAGFKIDHHFPPDKSKALFVVAKK